MNNIDSAVIRVTGAELRAAISAKIAFDATMRDLYERVAGEVQKADPSSEDGRRLARLFVEFHRMFSRITGGTTTLALIAQALELYTVAGEPAMDRGLTPLSSVLSKPLTAGGPS